MHNVKIKSHDELKDIASERLEGKRGVAALVTLILILLPIIIEQFPFGHLISFLIAGPLYVGASMYFLNLAKGEKATFDDFASGFNNFFSNFFLYLAIMIYTFLWFLLLIIPGIVKSFSYSMAYYIKCDNPNMSANEAIETSMKMMDGHKMRLFIFELTFIGWFLLSFITIGLAFLWVLPYFWTAHANFYLNLKENYLAKNQAAAL